MADSDPISEYLQAAKASLEALSAAEIEAVIDELHRAYTQGRQVFIIGNGGSAATASHLACDLAKTILGRPINYSAKRFRVLSLVDNISLLTAWSNDFEFKDIFAEQLKNQAQPADVLVAISGSGNSPNILAAVEAARALGMRCVGLLGFDGGQVKDQLDSHILVPSDHFGHVEDVHMMLGHLITAYFSQLVRRGATV